MGAGRTNHTPMVEARSSQQPCTTAVVKNVMVFCWGQYTTCSLQFYYCLELSATHKPTQTSYACLSSAGQSLSQAMPAPQHVYSSCIDNCSPARLAWTVIGWSAWLRISNIPLLRQSRREKLEQRGGIGLGALCGNCK